MHKRKPSHFINSTGKAQRQWMTSGTKTWVHSTKHEKNWPNKYFKNQSLEPWYFLSLELAVQYRVHEYMMLHGAMIRKKKPITVLWTSPNYLFTWILMSRSQFFSHFQNAFNSSSLDVPFQKKELFYSICQRQTESTYYEIKRQSFAYILVLIKEWSFKD